MSDTPNPAPDNSAPPPSGTPAPTPSSPAPAEPAKALTAEEKMARLAAVRAANAAKAAAKAAGGAAPATPATPVSPAAPAAAAAPKPAASASAAAAAAVPAKPFPPKAADAKDSGVDAKGAPAGKPASEHIAAAAATAKPAGGAKPPKAPEVPLPPPPQLQTRRTFIEWGFAAWLFFFTFLGAVGALFLRFMFPNVLYEQDPRFIAGKRSEYPESNKVYENFKQSQAVWLVRLSEEGQDRLVALSTVCTHLGCTPNWLDAERKFKCPCHGSGYYLNGVNFEGPTPRPLERFRILLDSAGNIIVDKSKKFRQDLGQWNENESFLVMG